MAQLFDENEHGNKNNRDIWDVIQEFSCGG